MKSQVLFMILILCGGCSIRKDASEVTLDELGETGIIITHSLALPKDMRESLLKRAKNGDADAAFELSSFSARQSHWESAFYWAGKARQLGHPQVTKDWLNSIELLIYDSAAPMNGTVYASWLEAIKKLNLASKSSVDELPAPPL